MDENHNFRSKIVKKTSGSKCSWMDSKSSGEAPCVFKIVHQVWDLSKDTPTKNKFFTSDPSMFSKGALKITILSTLCSKKKHIIQFIVIFGMVPWLCWDPILVGAPQYHQLAVVRSWYDWEFLEEMQNHLKNKCVVVWGTTTKNLSGELAL